MKIIVAWKNSVFKIIGKSFKTSRVSDFDEIKQDISSFRYEMLNHISVRQIETMENKERLDRLSTKMDQILHHQTELMHALNVTSGLPKSRMSSASSEREDAMGNNRSSGDFHKTSDPLRDIPFGHDFYRRKSQNTRPSSLCLGQTDL